MGSTGTLDIAGELEVLTAGCGVLDRSERGKLALTGPDSIEFLDGQVTNELANLLPGEGRYAAFLTHKGRMLGDLRIIAPAGSDPAAPPELLLDTERVSLQALFDMIRRYRVGYAVELHKRTVERALISLIGPEAAAVLGAEGLGGIEHSNAPIELDGVAALAIRTDTGIDLLCASEQAPRLLEALQAHGALAVSEQAAECLRVLAGRPRFGVDIDDTVIPQEAGLNERAVSFTKGCYVGQETVARLHYKGKPNRHLRGLLLAEPAAAGEEVHLGERLVGHLGSVADPPQLGPIALVLLRREAEPAATVTVGPQAALAQVCELPFPSER